MVRLQLLHSGIDRPEKLELPYNHGSGSSVPIMETGSNAVIRLGSPLLLPRGFSDY